MPTIQEIRRANVTFLLGEIAEELGVSRGAQAELAKRTNVPPTQISQFIRRMPHQGGEERAMGDDNSRKLERGMSKPIGWLDVDRTMASNHHEARMLDLWRQLRESDRNAVEALIQSLAHKPVRFTKE